MPTPTELRHQLRAAGYDPLPLSGKRPVFTEWQKRTNATSEEIISWSMHWPEAVNTGALTKFCPAIDVDLLNLVAAEDIEALARQHFEEMGRVLVRIGRAPKRAILLRCDEPFKKMTLSLIAPNGDTTQRIEVLCDGEQLAVHGIHPDTKQHYRWFGGEPWNVSRAELPLVTKEGIEAFLVDAERILVEHGYTSGKRKANGQDREPTGEHADVAALVDNILTGRELHDSLRDYAASLIGSGASKRQAIASLRALMDASQAPHDARWKERRAEIAGLVAGAEALRKVRGAVAGDVQIHDFVAYMPGHSYIFIPTREMWPAAAVNARLPPVMRSNGKPMAPAAWLDANAPVEQLTWIPGKPMLIKDTLVADGGWIERRGCTVFNLYRPPSLVPKVGDAATWLNHLSKLYPYDASHIVRWLAHRVQQPSAKINHALVLGGKQGIGKDTLLEPVKYAIGPWNFCDVTPRHVLGRFNGFVKSVILRISEARDLGDIDRYSFYDHLKLFTAAPPDVLRVDEKNLREYAVFNVSGVIMTTNHKTDGIYLPADDRRHYVAWSTLAKEDFVGEYWTGLHRYYDCGGNEAIAEYLASLDLSDFDAKAPPPKTQAFWEIVDTGRAPEDAELADVLDRLGNPPATTLIRVQGAASGSFYDWLTDRRNRRQLPYRFEQCGYAPVRSDTATDGLWVINGTRQVVYVQAGLSVRDRLAAAAR